MPRTLFGIRHHGPGCARALVAALEELQPEIVAIEAPADAESALELAGHEELRPPVAMLVYPPDAPGDASYFPFADWSPEWQAISWAKANGRGVRFIDLPMALDVPRRRAEKERLLAELKAEEEASATSGNNADDTDAGDAADASLDRDEDAIATDPIAVLSQAAGFNDPELWWEEQVERRNDAKELFTGIANAMTAVREEHPETRQRHLLREAYMRQALRAIAKDSDSVAVVCGAWHVPALTDEATAGKQEGRKAKDDRERLKRLPKVKTTTTWIPWTNQRLTYRSGYGAGMTSPGWYGHLWKHPDSAPTRWLITTARLLRDEDLDASSASVIEAVRLAETLAALRDRRSPGLLELGESIQAVLCHGNSAPLRLIRDRLEIGSDLGSVPSVTPTVPLARDLARQKRSLRLKPTADKTALEIDLRKENGLARSQLLHRLTLLGIAWGELVGSGGAKSTFRESWQLQWTPELSVQVIEANVYGCTVAEAAADKVRKTALDAVGKADDTTLPTLTYLLDSVLLAGLPESVPAILRQIHTAAASTPSVRQLFDALPRLARVCRYGDVRGTTAGDVEPVLVSLFRRGAAGLIPACQGLDDDASGRMIESLDHASEAIGLLDREGLTAEWHALAGRLANTSVHPLLVGRGTRLLVDAQIMDDDELARRARLALAPANPAEDCAAWAEGLLRGSALVLLNRVGVWQAFDGWLRSLSEDSFVRTLPMMRRAFADFTGPERRQMGETVRRLSRRNATTTTTKVVERRINHERGARVLPILRELLGGES